MFADPDLGRELKLWFTSPFGAGSIQSHLAYGAANGQFFAPATVAPGNFPNGAFFGIDMPFQDLVSQFMAGPPFQAALDGQGKYDSPAFTGLPSALTVYSVTLDNIFLAFPQVSAPVLHVVP
jgi:hypothetical protein